MRVSEIVAFLGVCMSIVTRPFGRSALTVLATMAVTGLVVTGAMAVGDPAGGAPAPVAVVSDAGDLDMAPMIEPMEDVDE